MPGERSEARLLCEVCSQPYIRVSGLSPAGLAFEHAAGTVHEKRSPPCPCCGSPYQPDRYCVECMMKHECALGTGHALLDEPTRILWVTRHRAKRQQV